jgi:hypothetical protein
MNAAQLNAAMTLTAKELIDNFTSTLTDDELHAIAKYRVDETVEALSVKSLFALTQLASIVIDRVGRT